MSGKNEGMDSGGEKQGDCWLVMLHSKPYFGVDAFGLGLRVYITNDSPAFSDFAASTSAFSASSAACCSLARCSVELDLSSRAFSSADWPVIPPRRIFRLQLNCIAISVPHAKWNTSSNTFLGSGPGKQFYNWKPHAYHNARLLTKIGTCKIFILISRLLYHLSIQVTFNRIFSWGRFSCRVISWLVEMWLHCTCIVCLEEAYGSVQFHQLKLLAVKLISIGRRPVRYVAELQGLSLTNKQINNK